MKKRIVVFLTFLSLLAALVVPISASAQGVGNGSNPLKNIDVSGPLSAAGTPTGGTFDGKLTVTAFQVVDDQLQAVGTVTGRILDSTGKQVATLTDLPVSLPVTIPSASCDILTLNLGAIHLDLLGLVVDTSVINVDITAQPGAGNLLGNLLCSVAGLLDGGLNLGILNQVADLLNQILAAL
jgi:hypothetical protein